MHNNVTHRLHFMFDLFSARGFSLSRTKMRTKRIPVRWSAPLLKSSTDQVPSISLFINQSISHSASVTRTVLITMRRTVVVLWCLIAIVIAIFWCTKLKSSVTHTRVHVSVVTANTSCVCARDWYGHFKSSEFWPVYIYKSLLIHLMSCLDMILRSCTFGKYCCASLQRKVETAVITCQLYTMHHLFYISFWFQFRVSFDGLLKKYILHSVTYEQALCHIIDADLCALESNQDVVLSNLSSLRCGSYRKLWSLR